MTTLSNHPKKIVAAVAAVGTAAYYGYQRYKKFVASRSPVITAPVAVTPVPAPVPVIQPVVAPAPVAPVPAPVVNVPQVQHHAPRNNVRRRQTNRNRAVNMAAIRRSGRALQQRGRARIQPQKRSMQQRRTVRGSVRRMQGRRR